MNAYESYVGKGHMFHHLIYEGSVPCFFVSFFCFGGGGGSRWRQILQFEEAKNLKVEMFDV